MRTFFVLLIIFLAFILFASTNLVNLDLTPNTPEVAQAAAPLPTQPVVITIQEGPTNLTPSDVVVPVTGGCANPYITQPGDWLIKIAAFCDTTLAFILQANPQIANQDLIYPNQQITIRYANAASSIPVTGLAPTIQSGTELRVQATNFLPNALVDVAIGPKNESYTVVTSGVTDGSGSLTTQITIPIAPDSHTPWVVAVITTSNPPVQVISKSFYIQ
jgi:LysM repeat protein